jgi:hypothetical protein
MTLRHVQNADCAAVGYWLKREELIVYAFAVKLYERRRWRVETLTVGAPKPTRWYTQAELMERGVVGLYAERA